MKMIFHGLSSCIIQKLISKFSQKTYIFFAQLFFKNLKNSLGKKFWKAWKMCQSYIRKSGGNYEGFWWSFCCWYV